MSDNLTVSNSIPLLKPCPHCDGEAKTVMSRFGSGYFIECTVCGARSKGFSGTISYESGQLVGAWNRRAKPEARALTVEELRQMSGKPVWIVEYPDWGHWELSEDAEDYFCDRDLDFYGMKHDDPSGKYGLHVLGWLAYDRQPVEGVQG